MLPLYNRELSSGVNIMERDEWEDQILKQMVVQELNKESTVALKNTLVNDKAFLEKLAT